MMQNSQLEAKFKNIKIAIFFVIGLQFFLNYSKIPSLEPYSLPIILFLLALVVLLFSYRIYLEVKNQIFDLKKYYLFLFFIGLSILISVYYWFQAA
jgi:hypothetical protein